MKQGLRQSTRIKFAFVHVIGCSVLLLMLITIWISIQNSKKAAATAGESLSSGSYIIDMGITPQTTANGLKPHGLVYDLVVNHSVPVKWVISSVKAKDEADFTYNAVGYKGGPFVVPAEFITPSIAAVISTWNERGVQGTYTTSAITVPVYTTITSFPRVMIDSLSSLQSIITAYYDSAGIPSSAYSIGTPAGLTACYDLWTNPHGDPTWATHYPLYNFVTVQKSFIWAECHSVSQMEACASAVLPVTQLNFLSTNGLQCWGANKCGAGVASHAKSATAPFTYEYPSDPIMQFMGTMHQATTDGSEQWYIPQTTGQWQNNVKRGVTTGTGSSPKEGAVLVYGPAYGNNSNGWVMYEGGHDLGTSGSSSTDRVAAVRAYLNYVLFTGMMRSINLNLTMNVNIQPGGTNIAVATAASGTPPYSYQWSSMLGGTFSNSNTATTLYTAPNVANGTVDIVKVIITDQCGRKNFAYQFVTISSTSLPVELLSFNGKRNSTGVTLNWTTATEKNNDYFTLERSEDGKVFHEITKINGKGNSMINQNYEYNDAEAPATKLYYRLKQTDLNGTQSDYTTIAVLPKSKSITIGGFSPNPFVDQFNITLQSEKSKNVSVGLYNIQGKLIKQLPYTVQEGYNLLLFKPECFVASGVYIVKVMSDDQLVASSKISCR